MSFIQPKNNPKILIESVYMGEEIIDSKQKKNLMNQKKHKWELFR